MVTQAETINGLVKVIAEMTLSLISRVSRHDIRMRLHPKYRWLKFF